MPNIIVSTEIDGETVDVGDLFFVPGRHDSHSARFTYDPQFLRIGWQIDPALRLDAAAHDIRGMPLAIEDAAPDSWGEMLLQRGERHAAEVEGRPARKLTPDQFLLAASDATRQGGLRFRTEQDGPFLGGEGAVPKTLEMADLLAAADQATQDSNSRDWQASSGCSRRGPRLWEARVQRQPSSVMTVSCGWQSSRNSGKATTSPYGK